MVAKPLKEGVEKLADMLAMIPYGLNHTKTIWQANFGKKTEVNQEIEKFTVGRDRERLISGGTTYWVPWHHITHAGIHRTARQDRLPVLLEELRRIHADIEAGRFIIEEGVEDDALAKWNCSSP